MAKDEDDDEAKEEPDEPMDSVKKDEEDGSDDDQEPAVPNHEDSDIRDMKYRLETLINASSHTCSLYFH